LSVFSNPAAGAKEDARNYITAILGLLGDADPLSVLEATPPWCEKETARLAPAQLAFREAPGKWCVGEILQHLADSEVVWGYRLRKVMAEERPRLTGFDQDLWARRLGYASASRDESLAVFSSLRAANVALLRRASEQDLDRVGVHAERGEESLRHMMRLNAGHDLAHRRQITRVLAAAAAPDTASRPGA
jgi:hypothetical protein